MSVLKKLEDYRHEIRSHMLWDEQAAIEHLMGQAALSTDVRQEIVENGAQLVQDVRQNTKPSIMEAFLAEYGLSTKEGLALMCLAEALLRVPDSKTMDNLIEDKIMSGEWAQHAGNSISALVNASTLGLQVTSAVMREGRKSVTKTLKSVVRRLGMPVIRNAVQQIMKELGRQFVLGQTIEGALKEAARYEKAGYTYSYDMLGEAAHTADDAEKYFQAYKEAIVKLSGSCTAGVRENPGISIKISALHPRYEQVKKERVCAELPAKILELAQMAKDVNMGFNIDAEEVDRLDLSLDLITAVLSDESLKGWDGFGIVVQAYGKRASFVLDYLYNLAQQLDRKIMIRLVKGAYWDAEIKRAQVMGLDGFPVYTRKENTDISYMSCAKKLLGMTSHIYPQFATHNAHTVAAVMAFAENISKESFEFQRLHGMGESLHEVLKAKADTRCRIYAPVGVHRDLLAYLVRRLLENGANSSFVNQIVDFAIPPKDVAKDPYERAQEPASRVIPTGPNLFGESRKNSKGFDETDVLALQEIDAGRRQFMDQQWQVAPLIADEAAGQGTPRETQPCHNPSRQDDVVGTITLASDQDVASAIQAADKAFADWSKTPVEDRAQMLEKTADILESRAYEIFAILTREAGKSLVDGVAELREAVDFLRYYANEMRRRADAENSNEKVARGIISCISPWNFPLAIFIGQIAAAVVAGNVVLAKPAEQTPIIAHLAIAAMHEAGVPKAVVQLLPGSGATVGAAITGHSAIAGVCFTGSTETAQIINRTMAKHCRPDAPLVAETGGLNAMIVDSTALPEQAVQDIIDSSFQSAGQRCSALRMLYVQEDVADRFLAMLYGAMDELTVGDPWSVATDVGPVIDHEAYDGIAEYLSKADEKGRILKQLAVPEAGLFVPPTVIKVSGIQDLEREIFGPVLHIATFKAKEFGQVLSDINSCGYGLTMGLHTRIDRRVDYVTAHAGVGNLYINRNQIGAIVGSQPFGGEGLSGTGPKAGGPEYLDVFQTYQAQADVSVPEIGTPIGFEVFQRITDAVNSKAVDDAAMTRALIDQMTTTGFADWQSVIADTLSALKSQVIDMHEMASPVGESNILRRLGRGTILCMGCSAELLIQQVITALYLGNRVIVVHPSQTVCDQLERLRQYFALDVICGAVNAADFAALTGIDAVAYQADDLALREIRQILAARSGKLIPLITQAQQFYSFSRERHCCIDTTASGGDAALLAG